MASFAFLLFAAHSTAADLADIRTAPVVRGDVCSTVRATGTLQPDEVVEVSAQVSGIIVRIAADYTSPVQAGALLAQLDDTAYALDVEHARASLARAQAELVQAKANAELATIEWQRLQELAKIKDVPAAEVTMAKCRLDVTQATVALSEAAIAQSEVGLKRAQLRLSYTRIVSPVSGVVIDRRVNVGQNVTDGLAAPSLFLIAKDLARMQLWASVQEADISQIRPGLPVRFTVDALPDRVFEGAVGLVRLNAALKQHVVTYTVVVPLDNADKKLLPYMTADVQFLIGCNRDVLLVPAAATRWQPPPEMTAPDVRREALAKQDARRFVWIVDGPFVRPIEVKIGLTDGKQTEITGDRIKEGMEVIVGEKARTSNPGGPEDASPFRPQFRRRPM